MPVLFEPASARFRDNRTVSISNPYCFQHLQFVCDVFIDNLQLNVHSNSARWPDEYYRDVRYSVKIIIAHRFMMIEAAANLPPHGGNPARHVLKEGESF